MWDYVSNHNQSAYDAARELWRPGDTMGDAIHSLDWGQYGDLQLGDYEKARLWIERIEEMSQEGGFLEGGARGQGGEARARNSVPLLKARYIVETEQWMVLPVTEESSNNEVLATALSAAHTGDQQTLRDAEALLKERSSGEGGNTGVMANEVSALLHAGMGHADVAKRFMDEAVAVDPAYPDVRVFRASQRHSDEDHIGAAADLVVLDSLAAPPIVGDLLAASRLRERIAVGLASDGDLLAALEVLDSGLSADPENGSLLAERGWLLVLTRTPELVQRGLGNLDEAVVVEPGDPHARAYRAVTLATVVGRPGDATADLEVFAAVDNPPVDLVDLLVGMGLLEG